MNSWIPRFLNAEARSGKGFEISFLFYVPVLNYTVEDEEDENSWQQEDRDVN